MAAIGLQRVHKKKNRSVESVLEFQQMRPKISKKFVTLMNSKATYLSKMLEFSGDK